MKCRHCQQALVNPFLDLGFAPPSNAYVRADQLNSPEVYYPLRLQVCSHCWLVQTEDYTDAEALFDADYAYFSSVSQGWLAHAAAHSSSMIERCRLGSGSFVIEVASNDGYLLRNFVAAGIPCLGVEPTASTAEAAEKLGVPTLRKFFGESLGAELARAGKAADVIFGNNVYAHVPDINDFTRGLRAALKPGGTISLEFPHLLRLIRETQFDTVYHEHFSYLSLTAVRSIFANAGLRVCDVDEIPTHGGSLRVYGCHANDARTDTGAVARVLDDEEKAGLRSLAVYQSFQQRADAVKNGLVSFLIEQKRLGKRVAGYGAAAKGNTLLNYGGVKPDLLSFVCDAAPSKQGKYLPGCHVPILAPTALRDQRPDVVLILPWNLASEVTRQHAYIGEWGGRFAVAVPEMRFLT